VTSGITTVGTWESEQVTVGQVEVALSALRRHERRAAVRTSVLTLVAVVDEPGQADAVLAIVSELGARHPSRTVVLVVGDADPPAPGGEHAGQGESSPAGQAPPPQAEGMDASASVHVVQRERSAVCFEDVVLRVRGRARFHLDSVVEPFTLPDLPVVVWLPSRLPALGDPLLAAADRIVIDSRAIPERVDLLGKIAVLARRLPVTDLSWIRLAPWRTLLAGLFEGGICRPFLRGVQRVEVHGNYGPRLLLGGWLYTRLGLRPEEVELVPADHVSIRVTAVADGRTGQFVVERPGAARVIESCIEVEGGPHLTQTLHMRRQWPAESLAQALTRMGFDDAYRQALAGAIELRP
jgi:glucose-6-phosphate dehydrogenase assembly protein OpcA